MVNYADLKHLKQIEQKLRQAADDPTQSVRMKALLDENPALWDYFADLYVRYLRTIERAADSGQ